VFWYVLIVVSLVYFAFYNVCGFKKFQIYIIITQISAMTAYILLPSRQDLRPEVFPRENIFTDLVRILYTIDTNTGVCPSLHVAYSFAMASVWTKEKSISILFRLFIVASVILICLSTVFLKQHSAVDFFAAIPICLFAEWFIYWRKQSKKDRSD
jgi:membrane-associated phospholipid phosphatase